MDCPNCGNETVGFEVPPDLRASIPGEETAVAICTRCLSLHPLAEGSPGEPDFSRVGGGFPTDPAAGIPMALLVGLLDSLALYRSEIADLLERVERAGVDPLLVLDRLAADDSIRTDLDLARRRRQLEQLV